MTEKIITFVQTIRRKTKEERETDYTRTEGGDGGRGGRAKGSVDSISTCCVNGK